MIRASKNHASRGRIYNLGSDNVPTQMEEVIKVKELAEMVCQVKHLSAWFARVLSFILRPLNINYLRKEHLLFILSNFMLDCDRAKTELGWKPVKDNIEILVETIKWYRNVKL
jgi:nucleoside-diphosphate-sugar epimerase